MCTRAATHTTYNGAVTFSGQDMGGHGRHQGPRHQRHARRPTPPQTSRQLPYASMQQVYLQLHLLLAAGCLSRLLGTFLGPSLLLCVAAGLQGNAQQQQQSRQRVRHITCCPCMRASSTAMQLKLSPSALLLLAAGGRVSRACKGGLLSRLASSGTCHKQCNSQAVQGHITIPSLH